MINKNGKYTILTTIYNTNPFIDNYITSINGLDASKFELILVDDGSKDNVVEYVQQNLNSDVNIKVYHQENTGILIALLNGIKQANNEYIIIFDSDDILSPEILDYLDKATESNPDVVHYKNCSYRDINVLNLSDTNEIKDITHKKEEMTKNFLEKNMYGTLSEKCFKRTLLDCAEIIKNGTIRFTPDIVISFYIFMNCKTLVNIDKTFYFAPINNRSTSKSFEDFRFSEYKQLFTIFEAYCKETFDENTQLLIKSRFIREAIYSITHLFLGKNPQKMKMDAIHTVEHDEVFVRVAAESVQLDVLKRIPMFTLKKKLSICTYVYMVLISRLYILSALLRKK